MIGKAVFGQVFNGHMSRKQRVASTIAVLLALILQSFDLHAALLFRKLEQVNGQLRWSALKNYANPADTAYAEATANGVPPVEVRVFLSGEITRADVESAAVMERLIKSGGQKLADNAVWFGSGGGDIDAGMELGRLLRRLGIFALVGRDEQCLSACVFAFMGGERRSVAGQLGIHRPYFPFTEDTPDRQARFRHLQRTIKYFVAEMDFPDSLYEAVMLVPPESMQILSTVELKKYYLDGISPSSEDRADAAAARRLKLTMVEYLQRKAQAPVCGLIDAAESRCESSLSEAASRTGPVGTSAEQLSGHTRQPGWAGYQPF